MAGSYNKRTISDELLLGDWHLIAATLVVIQSLAVIARQGEQNINEGAVTIADEIFDNNGM